ncbi:MAG TPA: hypothetical protein VMZ03_02140 [Chitinophagaceae bacterium]|nr:hypothetical protein [Chitinophagaceae bacterium]
MTRSFFISIAIAAGCFVSCKKNSAPNQPPAYFSWSINGGTGQVSDTTSFLSLFGINTIFGTKGTTNVYISTNSTNTGIYSKLSASAGFGVIIAGTQYNSISGIINIISNTDRRLSGTFGSQLIATIDTIDINGNFSNIRY